MRPHPGDHPGRALTRLRRLRTVLDEYATHYSEYRPHPAPGPALASGDEITPAIITSLGGAEVTAAAG
jgi:hypothetical protein